jgi:isoleucyl-tRNA synthetase
MFVKADFTLNEFYKEIIEDELNVKEVTFTDDVSELTTYNFKPQLKTVGPKYGKQLGGIREYLANVDGNKAMAELKANGAIKFDVAGTEVSLAEEDLLIEMTQKEGYVTEADNYVTVVLDTNLTEELLEEGCVNEIISKLQTMRKDSGFEVMDRIKVYIDGNDKLADVVKKNEAAIAGKVLANEFLYNATTALSKEWNIHGEKVSLGVEKI